MGTEIAGRCLTIGFVLGLLAGCAGVEAPQEPAPRPAPPETREEQPPPSVPGERKAAMPEAVRELVSRAEDSSAAGEHDRAVAFLERALRIVPRHPIIWQNLAVVRYRQGRYAQAESLALKSIALAGDDAALKRQDWKLIGAVRDIQGDKAGAKEARARAARRSDSRSKP